MDSKTIKVFIGLLLASVLLLFSLCTENKEAGRKEPAIVTTPATTETTASIAQTSLSDIQKEACNTAQEKGTCDKLKDLDLIVTVEECCKNLNKCCGQATDCPDCTPQPIPTLPKGCSQCRDGKPCDCKSAEECKTRLGQNWTCAYTGYYNLVCCMPSSCGEGSECESDKECIEKHGTGWTCGRPEIHANRYCCFPPEMPATATTTTAYTSEQSDYKGYSPAHLLIRMSSQI